MARLGVRAVVEAAVREGVKYVKKSVVSPGCSERLQTVTTIDGEHITARTFVFACGPWLPKVFSELLRPLFQITRQEVFCFGPLAGDRRFAPPAMPVWIDFSDLVSDS